MDITALANETRLHLIHCLEKPQTVSELLEKCDLSQPALSQHLKKLKDAGIVQSTREGVHQVYSVTNPQISRVVKELLQLTTQ